MQETRMTRADVAAPRELAEAVRRACVQAALDAYEQGGIAGLCAEGRWELAVDAMRALNVEEIVKSRGVQLNAPT